MHDHPAVSLRGVANGSRLALLTMGAALGISLFAGNASAQQHHLSVGAGWYNPGGGDFGETDSGPGLDVAVRFAVGQRLYLAFGRQWNSNGVEFTDDDWNVVAIFFEPSLVLATGAAVEPFLAGRVGWLRQSITTSSGRRTGNGVGFGGFVGLRVPVASRLSVELVAPFYGVSFGDVEVDGVERPNSDSSGRVFGIRIALNIGF
ncbi:MAG: hypothetical protein BMS9Abin29_1605 [Gemmatimonadota bacterium]|nr:MAG: hypothetical protein BMS9Abin29_1605 [Gemmatimonadota bacterium]